MSFGLNLGDERPWIRMIIFCFQNIIPVCILIILNVYTKNSIFMYSLDLLSLHNYLYVLLYHQVLVFPEYLVVLVYPDYFIKRNHVH